ncbi:MAG: hypothetical protein WCF25_07360 [Acidimicrobiales bacterium]
MTTPTVLTFSDDRVAAVAALDGVGEGRGWCNVAPVVEEEVADMKVNYFGLRLNKGVTVASFVTAVPRRGVAQPSTLGVLHSRSRLGKERIAAMLDGAPFVTKQDHNTRGLLLEVPVATPSALVLTVMCSLTEALCDYDFTGRWTLSQFLT